MTDMHTEHKKASTMKYTHDNHVRMILLWHGLMGFDSFKEAESAILKDPEWFNTWDTKDWHLDDLTSVTQWRESNVATNAVNTVSNNILSRYFGVKGALN